MKELEAQEEEAREVVEVQARMARLRSDADTASVGEKRKAKDADIPNGKKAKVESGAEAVVKEDETSRSTTSLAGSGSPDVEMEDATSKPAAETSKPANDLPKDYSMPAQVNLAPEEARALFKVRASL